jgi:two-component system response regulator RegX3
VTRILVVEDEESFRDALSYMLSREGFEVDLAGTGPAALEQFDRHGADLVLLDLMLPGLSGTEVFRSLRARSGVPVIMLTAKDSEVDKVVGLELGADDYVTKPYSPRELVARIRAVLRRQRRAERNVFGMAIRAGDAALDVGEMRFVAPGREPATLTVTEMKILELLMRNANAVISRETLVERVWGYDCDGTDNRVNVYIRRLREKIERDPAKPEYLETVRGLGYRFRAAAGAPAAVPGGPRAPRIAPARIGEGPWAATGD